VDDVVTAVEVLKAKYPQVDPSRIGIIGWSHGGMITLLSIFRNPALFKSAVAMVPVTNLFQRLAWKGVERQHQLIDPQNRFGGLPADGATSTRSARRSTAWTSCRFRCTSRHEER
jgi:dipeptidyl aminopeptidase/acylaminoacyl peptidase